MLARKRSECPPATGGEADAYDAVIVGVRAATYEAGGCGSVDELDDAVVSEEQLACEVSDRRRPGTDAPDREQELMLRGGDARFGGAFLGPPKVPAEPGAKGEEAPIVVVGESHRHENIVAR